MTKQLRAADIAAGIHRATANVPDAKRKAEMTGDFGRTRCGCGHLMKVHVPASPSGKFRTMCMHLGCNCEQITREAK